MRTPPADPVFGSEDDVAVTFDTTAAYAHVVPETFVPAETILLDMVALERAAARLWHQNHHAGTPLRCHGCGKSGGTLVKLGQDHYAHRECASVRWGE
jgi:hypothetical protein